MEQLLSFDTGVFFWINNSWACPFLDVFFLLMTWLGNGYVAVGFVVLVLLLGGRESLKTHLPWILIVLLISGFFAQGLKKVVERPRPLSEFAPLIEAGKVHVRVLGETLRLKSFPSGHAQTAFAVATYLALLFRPWSPWILLTALAVGLSRVYIGVHFPLDVLAGAAIGAGTSSLIWWVRKRVMARRVRLGPSAERSSGS